MAYTYMYNFCVLLVSFFHRTLNWCLLQLSATAWWYWHSPLRRRARGGYSQKHSCAQNWPPLPAATPRPPVSLPSRLAREPCPWCDRTEPLCLHCGPEGWLRWPHVQRWRLGWVGYSPSCLCAQCLLRGWEEAQLAHHDLLGKWQIVEV